MRTIVQEYNSTRVKLLRQREEPAEAIPEEGGGWEQDQFCTSLGVLGSADQNIPAPFLWEGRDMGWQTSSWFATCYWRDVSKRAMNDSSNWEGDWGRDLEGFPNFRSSVTTPGAGRAAHFGEQCQDWHIPSHPLASQPSRRTDHW